MRFVPGRPRAGSRSTRRRGQYTLRTRLVLLSIALTAVISLAIGLASVLSLQVFLQRRLDNLLTNAVQRSQDFSRRQPSVYSNDGVPALLSNDPRRQNSLGPGFLTAPGQGENTLGAQIKADGTVGKAAVLSSSGDVVGLSDQQDRKLVAIPVDRSPHTVDLGGDLGKYRVIAERMGDSGGIQITGLPLSAVHAAVLRLAAVVSAVSFTGLLAVAALGTWIVRRTLRPLYRVAQVATDVAQLPLHHGETALPLRVPDQDTDPATEVGQVGAALNRLLGHVDSALQQRNASEARVRRFVADASHELRTPLASIRGYAELTRRSRAEIAPEVAHSLSRVESEAIRMTGLVEELLMLARLDEGRPVAHDPVDLTHLLIDAVSDAHAANLEHRWALDLPDEPVTVTGDEPQLHQIVTNLLANAGVHTPVGTQVRAGLQVRTGAAGTPEAVLTITDDGPGIAPQLLPEVFVRFARGDDSRSRASGSTGLGLSIVAAVVAAHGGTVGVTSEPGRTTFEVRLPAEPPEQLPADPDDGPYDSEMTDVDHHDPGHEPVAGVGTAHRPTAPLP